MHTGNHTFSLLVVSVSLFMSFFINAQEQADVDGVNEFTGNTIFLVRHFEKQSSDTDTQNKPTNDPKLTERGQARAQALAAFLAEKNVTAVFSTNYNRTLQTATPTAQQYGINITVYNPSELAQFALQLKALAGTGNGNILVVGHSNTMPQLLKLLGGPDKVLSEDDYGDLFSVSGLGNEQSALNSFHHVVIE